jgi:biopolymer transport protein ExbD
MSLTASRQDEDVMAEINITPFTDVLLVLLIIFMILASLVTPPGFQKELPNKPPVTENQQDQKKREIDIEVSEKGTVFVDGRKTDERGVYDEIARTVRKRGKLHVAITADAKAKYDIIIKILDAARVSGLEDVGFVTS